MSARRRIIVFGFLLVLGLFLMMAATQKASEQVAAQLQRHMPFPVTYGKAHWRWPVGVSIEDFTVASPTGKEPYFLRTKELTLTPPIWAIFMRPLPVTVSLDRPHLMLNDENFGHLLGKVPLPQQGWMKIPGMEQFETQDWTSDEKESDKPFPFLLFGLDILQGRIDASSEDLRPGEPVFSLAELNLTLSASALVATPTIALESQGHFVDRNGKKLGEASAALKAQPLQGQMEGSLRLRHEQLRDFRLVYQYAPRPILIEGGTADVTIQWWLSDRNHLRLEARCLVENLDLDGMVEEVSWSQIMHAVEDPNRRYEWNASAEGRLDDRRFNPHDQILSQVEWMMKEKAAAGGLKISGQMFFYEDAVE